MRGVSLKAVLLATAATLGLDIVSGMLLLALLGGDSLAPTLTDDQRRAAIMALASNPAFMVPSLVLGTLTTVIGGYLTARIAKTLPYMNSLAFGLLGIVIAVLTAQDLPLWYSVLGIGSLVPAALVGGYIAKRQMQST